MLYSFFKSFFQDSIPGGDRVFSFRELLDAIGEASRETGRKIPHLADSLEWTLDRIGVDHAITFHSTWSEHGDARAYFQSLVTLDLVTYLDDGQCVTVELNTAKVMYHLNK